MQRLLVDYTTKESDALKGISKMPLNVPRLTEEDLVNLEQFNKLRMSMRPEIPNHAVSVSGIPNVEETEEMEDMVIDRGKPDPNEPTQEDIENDMKPKQGGQLTRSIY